ncbi:membrane protein insertase YidC [Enterobacteriaceae endosymbiont of Donacia dentata]|uniref:membrane protein insertase YidC n=1 Tax=Enterobacteriaceae endosymbiont of Donacia dentata TaxID=2675777 RepID=UPI0014497DE4|nr:membrane protein insertase YidC [Enterobacteriaceae endosymbiont of Donacia dentata]QJC32667.1 membrane protein insertase YidC [Enterobacteriaceae endosymbiont of Donacia dentata]
MYSKNNFILIIFCLFSCTILYNWGKIHNYTKNNTKLIINKNILNHKNYKKFFNITKKNNIIIKTDKLLLYINPYGGNIEKVYFLNYSDKLNSKNFFTLLKNKSDFIYQIKCGILKEGNFKKIEDIYKNEKFFSKKKYFYLGKNKNILKVPLIFNKKNILYVKMFTFIKGSYAITVNHQIFNKTLNPIYISVFGQINHSNNIPKKYLEKKNNISIKTFNGIAYSTEYNKFKKYKFSNIKKNKNINIYTKNGWIAVLQQYFTSAWIIPNYSKKNNIYIKNISNNIISIGFKTSNHLILSGEKKFFLSKLWIGPKISEQMSKVAPFLDLTIDYGFLWFLSKPLFKLLNLLFNITRNWGFSIILITIIIRIITYPLSKQQYVTIAKMHFLQPKIKKIKEIFGNDKKRFSQEILLLYKKEKLNPFSGFVPFLIQMPIFLALYYVLTNSIELRHTPFLFWIQDLSSEDPYYILPILMSISMLVIQKISKNDYEDDPIQKKIAYIIPIFFSLFFLWLPSGLVLYYIVNNLITILQQKWIYHIINKEHYGKK